MDLNGDTTPRYWFTSSLFEAEPGEDAETNPRLYGRQPAAWLHEKLRALGYAVEPVFGEDWGWCLVCQRQPYRLMIGCVSYPDYEFAVEGDPPPAKESLLWNTVIFAEVPVLEYLFRRRRSAAKGVAKLDADLRSILQAEPAIRLVDDSAAEHWFDHRRSEHASPRAARTNSAGMSLGARIILALFAALFGVATIAIAISESGQKAIFMAGFGMFCLSIALACVLRGRLRQFFGSVVGSVVFLVSLTYLGAELGIGALGSVHAAGSSIAQATMFLVVFGLPGAFYTVRARFGFGKAR